MKHVAAMRAVVVVATISFLGVVAAIVTVMAMSYGGHLRETQADIMRAAPRLYAQARPQYDSPERTAAAAFRDLPVAGWRLILSAPPAGFEGPPGGPGGPPPGGGLPGGGPPQASAGPGPSGALAALIGVVPRRVPLVDVPLDVVPDLDRFTHAVLLVFLATLLVLAFGGATLWRFARAIGDSAFEPVVQTTQALRRLAAHDFTPHMIVTDDRSAIGDLARAYNDAAEQVAIAIRRERDAAEAEMQRFLADAGHELRTPVTIIMGYLDILRGLALPENQTAERVVNGMRSEMARMRTLIEKLIVLSRLESTQAENESVDIVAVVTGVKESLAALAGSRAIDVEVPSSAYVLGDENDLHEAVLNLVENALKYAPDSDVRVAVRETADAVRIDVADRGPGMDSVDLRRAFERFYRGAGRAGADGSGLGLAIVKRAIERCRGTVTATSTPGAGACFTIELPRPGTTLGGAA